MPQAIFHYALSPLLIALLPLAAINVAIGHGAGTPRGALLALLTLAWGTLLLPKLVGYMETLMRHDASRRRLTLLREMVVEMLLIALINPITTLEHCVTMLRLLSGHRGGWAPQAREAQGISWIAAAHRFGAHTLVGFVLLGSFAAAGPFSLAASLPFVAGLLLAIPVYVLTGQPIEPRRQQSAGQQGIRARPATSVSAATNGLPSAGITALPR